jgi:hypothetical protein
MLTDPEYLAGAVSRLQGLNCSGFLCNSLNIEITINTDKFADCVSKMGTCRSLLEIVTFVDFLSIDDVVDIKINSDNKEAVTVIRQLVADMLTPRTILSMVLGEKVNNFWSAVERARSSLEGLVSDPHKSTLLEAMSKSAEEILLTARSDRLP